MPLFLYFLVQVEPVEQAEHDISAEHIGVALTLHLRINVVAVL